MIFCSCQLVSDDTNHDSVMTNYIIEEIIQQNPRVIQSGTLQLCSDNCSVQYKSRFVFRALLDLAIKYKIRINWFFGEAGHARGLIDAMAWFGCKRPMRKEIVTNDAWYANSAEMTEFLKEHFKNDKSKVYNLITEEMTASIREEVREEREVKGCKVAHVLSFFPDGYTVKLWASGRDFMTGDEVDKNTIEEDIEDEIVDGAEPRGSN